MGLFFTARAPQHHLPFILAYCQTKIDEPLIISVVLYAQLGDLFVSFTYKSPKKQKKKKRQIMK